MGSSEVREGKNLAAEPLGLCFCLRANSHSLWVLQYFLQDVAHLFPERQSYYGKTDTMAQVVQDINKNNQKISSLWAELNYDAMLVDENGKKTDISNSDGNLMYRPPQSLLLRCNVLNSEAFALGSNDDVFWVTIAQGDDSTWWGHYRNLGKACCKPLPFRPDLVIEVLGVGVLDTNFMEQPVPVMRFNNDADAYMFTWNVQGRDRWMAQKEVWYDRATKQPTMVLLFDENGRIILRAYLADYRPVEVPNAPKESWPQIAHEYQLFFPENHSTLSFTFSDSAIQHKGVPVQKSFQMPEPETKQIIQIDKDCHD